MEINFLERDRGSWVIEVKDADHTLLNLLKKKLQDDKNVKFAGYNQPHPLVNKFVLTVKGSNVKLSVDNAVKELKAELTALGKELKQ